MPSNSRGLPRSSSRQSRWRKLMQFATLLDWTANCCQITTRDARRVWNGFVGTQQIAVLSAMRIRKTTSGVVQVSSQPAT